MAAGPLPCVADIVPGMAGHGVLRADPADFEDIALALISAGYVVAEIDGGQVQDLGAALSSLRRALHLRAGADQHLQALADGLGNLPESWPQEEGVALLWRAAEQFAEADERSWRLVRNAMAEASAELRESGFAFESVAFFDGYDLAPLLLGVPRDGGPAL